MLLHALRKVRFNGGGMRRVRHQQLAQKSRDLQHSESRWLTDLILGKERTFTTQLVGRGPYSEYYGDLSITLDTATYGQGFIVSSVIIFISGVLRALVTLISHC